MIIDKNAPEGNAFSIMAIVQRLLKKTGRDEEWLNIEKRMMEGDYENLCEVATEVSYGAIEFEE